MISATLKNKRGEAMMEAAIVVPMIVLMIISMLYLLIHFYSGIKKQTESHELLCERAMKESVIFKVERNEADINSYVGGLIKKRFSRHFDDKCYILNPADGVRLKEGLKNAKE